MITRNFELTLRIPEQDYVPSCFRVVQNDKSVYSLTIKLTDGISEVTYSQIVSATVTFAKADGNVVQGNMTVGVSSLTYTMGTNEIAYPGVVYASIQLFGASNERLTSARFMFDVVGDLITPSALQSTSEFPVLQELTNDVSGIIATEASRVTAENARVTAENARNIEVVAARGTFGTLDGRLDDSDSKLADIANQLDFPATNLIDGGSFPNSAGWEGPNVTVSASNNTLYVTGNGNSPNNYIDKLTSIVCGNSHKIYIRGLFTVTNAVCQGLNIYAYGSSGGGAYLTTSPAVANPVQNQQYPISGILDLSSFAGNLVIRLSNYYADAAAANGKVMEVQYVSAIDLTATFDAAMKPSKPSEMDNILSKFPNSWFDGTVNSLLNHKEIAIKTLQFDFPTTSIVFNGGFSIGTAGWGANDCTLSAAANEMICTYLLVSGYAGAFQFKTVIAGHKYYVAADLYPKYARAVHLSLDNTYFDIPTSVANEWNHYSFISIAVANGPAPLTLYHDVSSQYAAGDTWKFRRAIVIDLTARFGAGNEPSAARMDSMLSKFPNSWFDGTVNLFNAEDIQKLYAEKADKVVEEPIAPTLINGRVNGDLAPVMYYKDDFGIVHLMGGVKSGIEDSSAFILTNGYKPGTNRRWPGGSSGVLSVVTITTDGNVYISGTTTTVSLDGISFHAGR